MENNKEIFLKGIENLSAIGRKEQLGITTSIKILVFYIILCILAEYQNSGKKLFFINGIPEVKRKDPTDGTYNRIYVRKFSLKFKDLVNWTSLPSLLTRQKRFGAVIYALFHQPKGGHNLGRWIEFTLLAKIFQTYSLDKVASFGHYDEFTYWLTSLCEEKGVHYTMYQHGITMDSIQVPNKIYSNKVHIYNQYSENVFKTKIIGFSECEYIVDGFKTNIHFSQIRKESGKKYIGIIDQTFPDWIKQVTAAVSEIEDCVAVIMLHPLTKVGYFKEDENKKIVETREKYDNLDCIISDFSTLVLDYLSMGYDAPIVCTSKDAVEGLYKEYSLQYIDKSHLKERLSVIIGIIEDKICF